MDDPNRLLAFISEKIKMFDPITALNTIIPPFDTNSQENINKSHTLICELLRRNVGKFNTMQLLLIQQSMDGWDGHSPLKCYAL